MAMRGIDVRLIDTQVLTPTAPSESGHPHGDEKHDHDHEHGGLLGENTELIFSAICGGLLLSGWLLSSLTSVSVWWPWSLSLAAYFFGGYCTFREAFENVRAGRLEIDLLMLVSAVGAATLGEWAEGALLLFLFSLGQALEHYAMGRAKRAIEALAELAPQTAVVRRADKTLEVPVEQLVLSDVVIVKPNERMRMKEQGQMRLSLLTRGIFSRRAIAVVAILADTQHPLAIIASDIDPAIFGLPPPHQLLMREWRHPRLDQRTGVRESRSSGPEWERANTNSSSQKHPAPVPSPNAPEQWQRCEQHCHNAERHPLSNGCQEDETGTQRACRSCQRVDHRQIAYATPRLALSVTQ